MKLISFPPDLIYAHKGPDDYRMFDQEGINLYLSRMVDSYKDVADSKLQCFELLNNAYYIATIVRNEELKNLTFSTFKTLWDGMAVGLLPSDNAMVWCLAYTIIHIQETTSKEEECFLKWGIAEIHKSYIEDYDFYNSIYSESEEAETLPYHTDLYFSPIEPTEENLWTLNEFYPTLVNEDLEQVIRFYRDKNDQKRFVDIYVKDEKIKESYLERIENDEFCHVADEEDHEGDVGLIIRIQEDEIEKLKADVQRWITIAKNASKKYGELLFESDKRNAEIDRLEKEIEKNQEDLEYFISGHQLVAEVFDEGGKESVSLLNIQENYKEKLEKAEEEISSLKSKNKELQDTLDLRIDAESLFNLCMNKNFTEDEVASLRNILSIYYSDFSKMLTPSEVDIQRRLSCLVFEKREKLASEKFEPTKTIYIQQMAMGDGHQLNTANPEEIIDKLPEHINKALNDGRK